MATHLVDTSAAARIRAGEIAGLLVPLIGSGRVATCAALDFEALYSSRTPGEYEQMRSDRAMAYEYLSTDDADWQRAVDIQRELARHPQQRAVGMPDLLIAAVAERHRVTIIHYDSDFDTIARVTGQPTMWAAPRGSVL